MLKAIISLFSSSMIGRIIGLFRFQLMLYLFSQSVFTDDIIYTTTLIWTINNFFITPLVNKSLISDLNITEQNIHISLVKKTIYSVLKITGIISIILIVSINFIQHYTDAINYNNIEVLCILIIISLLGLNEVFSLYNQYNNKYFVYAFNRSIWNLVLIFGLIVISIIDIESLLYYLLFMLASIIFSIAFQIKNSNFKLKLLLEYDKSYMIVSNSVDKNLWYNGIILIYLGLTFIDLNLLKNNSSVGVITTFTILLKLPELILSLINGSVLPVFFNSIIKDYNTLLVNMMKYKSIALILYLILFLITFKFGSYLFDFMFNFTLTGFESLAYYAILMMFFNALSYMYVRLSVDFKYTKALFFISLLSLLTKLCIIYYDITIEIILLSNIAFYIIIYTACNLFIMNKKRLV